LTFVGFGLWQEYDQRHPGGVLTNFAMPHTPVRAPT
jgi:hypothetical protein